MCPALFVFGRSPFREALCFAHLMCKGCILYHEGIPKRDEMGFREEDESVYCVKADNSGLFLSEEGLVD